MKAKVCGIYFIKNLIDNKYYIGRSINCNVRLQKHILSLNLNSHINSHLQSAWNKYGSENFEFEILEEYKKEFLSSMENWWCNMLNTHDRNFGYNILPTSPESHYCLSEETKIKIGFSNKGKVKTKEQREQAIKNFGDRMLGKKHSEETKKKISESNKGKVLKKESYLKGWETRRKNGWSWSEDSLKKRSESVKGLKRNQEWKDKISKANKGKIRSEESRKRISQSLIGKKRSAESIKKQKESINKK